VYKRRAQFGGHVSRGQKDEANTSNT